MTLAAHLQVLDGYCRALAGRRITVAPTSQIVHKRLGWARPELPTTDGSTIFLPDTLALPAGALAPPLDAFAWYKLMATHQAGLLEHGSFDLVYERAHEGHAEDGAALTHYGRYFSRFAAPLLARDLFAIAEALRVDACVLRRYAGLASAMHEAQARCTAMRPWPAREQRLARRVEALLHASLGASAQQLERFGEDAPSQRIRDELARLQQRGTRVADSARVTDVLYAGVIAGLEARAIEAHEAPAPVPYRGVFKPELGQLLRLALDEHDVKPPEQASALTKRTQLRDLARTSPEVELGATEIPPELSAKALADDLEDELAERGPPPPPGRDDEASEGGGGDGGSALEATERGSFVYDEWDAGASRFRSRHCLLRELQPASRASTFYEDTLAKHASLAARLRQQLACVAARHAHRLVSATDGEELDLEACVQAVIDRRRGCAPSERLFARRDVRVRDVAAAFVLDMSSSTGDPLDPSENRHAPAVRRLIDVEKEALVLLTDALAGLGDRYGIYGFSGYGRKAVEVFVLKELSEPLSERVKLRIAAVEPRNATRMGAAIRHVTQKLAADSARSRFLFLLSDGRPRDQGYGNHGSSQHYAVADTRMALLEAQRRGITPFCLAVDRSGHEYLGAMMQDMRYEVLWDPAMLPERMTQLYRALST